jgi:arginyl-tRNA synthetase
MRINPRDFAEQISSSVPRNGLIASCEASGPGFLNITLSDGAIIQQIASRLADPRLGVSREQEGVITVVDYSQPNIAKEMHVGHLRSTIIGDALVRVLGFLGAKVIRQNHLGDWGTQFGMFIQFLEEHPEVAWRSQDVSSIGSVSTLNELYRTARQEFDEDPSFAERARSRVVALQSGDQDTLERWNEIVTESKRYFNHIYDRLGVLLEDQDAVGESFYNPFLNDLATELEQRGVAVLSDGALCVFFEDITGPDGNPTPLIVRKRDGGFGYAATDLAAIRYRVRVLNAKRLLYVVDARQALHFKMVFETAKRAGWLTEEVQAIHVGHGTVLGPDGRPFKTRSGETVRLSALLNDAVDRAKEIIAAKGPHLGQSKRDRLAHIIGIAAVKYAELSISRSKDYIFDVNRMVSFDGNTGVYLQYAHARISSMLRKVHEGVLNSARPHSDVQLKPAEHRLGLLLDEFQATLVEVAAALEPYRLSNFLYVLAQAFTDFYESCPVLRAERSEVRDNRILLCLLTAHTLRRGLNLLGIDAPDQL